MFARVAARAVRAVVRSAPRIAVAGAAGFTFAYALPAIMPTAECAGAETIPFTGVPGTPTERSFIAIKPDGVQRGLVGEIIARFEAKGYKLVAIKMLTPTKAQAQAHYADLSARPFFAGLVEFFSSGPIVAMVWEGHNVIKGGRVLLGTTNPADSAPGTIRGDYAVVTGRNIIHGSDGPESAKAEITHWFKPEELNNWTPAERVWIYEGK